MPNRQLDYKTGFKGKVLARDAHLRFARAGIKIKKVQFLRPG